MILLQAPLSALCCRFLLHFHSPPFRSLICSLVEAMMYPRSSPLPHGLQSARSPPKSLANSFGRGSHVLCSPFPPPALGPRPSAIHHPPCLLAFQAGMTIPATCTQGVFSHLSSGTQRMPTRHQVHRTSLWLHRLRSCQGLVCGLVSQVALPPSGSSTQRNQHPEDKDGG